MSLVGADQHVEDRQRATAHGADVGDVRHHRRGARGARLRGDERRQDRLAAQHDPLVAVGDQRTVVAVADRAETAHELQVALGVQGRQVADRGRQRLDVGHRRDPREPEIGGQA
jgi:hypothetical protein